VRRRPDLEVQLARDLVLELVLLIRQGTCCPRKAEYVPGEVIVRYKAGTSSAERSDTRRDAEASLERKLPVRRVELLGLDRGRTGGPGRDRVLHR
jgi:hypothetical protein